MDEVTGREAFFGRRPRQTMLKLPGLGLVCVRGLTHSEWEGIARETRQRQKKDPANVRELERIAIAGTFKESGEPAFTPADEIPLSEIPLEDLTRITELVYAQSQAKDDGGDAGN